MPKLIPKQDKDRMVELFLNGDRVSVIEIATGHDRSTCISELKRRGVYEVRKRGSSTPRIPQKDRDGMVEAYLGGSNATEAAATFGYDRGSCTNELRRRGMPQRSISEIHRSYTVDDTFFDDINTEAKAYWLGFLSADGCVCGNRITVGLCSIDKQHLSKLLSDIKSNHPIEDYSITMQGKAIVGKDVFRKPEYHICRTSITNKRLRQALSVLGVGPCKSLTISPCQKIPDELLHHYWRGIIDGDGSISHDKTGKWSINLSGNLGMVTGFLLWVRSFCGTTVEPRRDHRGQSFDIRFSGNRLAKRIVSKLYGDANVYLNRKYERAILVMDTEIKKQDCSDLTLEHLDHLRSSCDTWNDVASIIGINVVSLRRIRRKLKRQTIDVMEDDEDEDTG